MKQPKILKQDELALLAAVVFAGIRGKKPFPNAINGKAGSAFVSPEEQSVRVAAGIWLHAGEYCERLNRANTSADKSKKWLLVGDSAKAVEVRRFARWADPTKTVPTLNKAWEWVQQNATAKKDGYLSLPAFEKAWDEFNGPNHKTRLVIPISRLEEFLQWRTTERSKARQLRQRKSKKKLA